MPDCRPRRFVRWVFDRRGGALVHTVKTTAFSYSCTLALLLPIVLFARARGDASVDQRQDLTPFDVLVAAPLIENIVMIGVVEFLLAFELPTMTIVVSVACVSGIAHGLAGEFRAVAGFIMFATMAYTYLLWSGHRFVQRYATTLVQHLLFNVPIAFQLVV